MKKNNPFDVHKIKNKNHYVNSKKQLFRKLNLYLNSNNKIKNLTNYDKQALNYYLVTSMVNLEEG